MTFAAVYLQESYPAYARFMAKAEGDLCRVARQPDDNATQLRLAEELERRNHQALHAWLRSGRSI